MSQAAKAKDVKDRLKAKDARAKLKYDHKKSEVKMVIAALKRDFEAYKSAKKRAIKLRSRLRIAQRKGNRAKKKLSDAKIEYKHAFASLDDAAKAAADAEQREARFDASLTTKPFPFPRALTLTASTAPRRIWL